MGPALVQTGRILSNITPKRARCLDAVASCQHFITWLRNAVGGNVRFSVFRTNTNISLGFCTGTSGGAILPSSSSCIRLIDCLIQTSTILKHQDLTTPTLLFKYHFIFDGVKNVSDCVTSI